MDRGKEKTTAPYPPVGADGGQSLSQKPNQSIAEGVTEHKPPERDLEEILRQISRVNDPAYLPTVSMNDLYEQVYPGRPPVVDGLLYAGTYLFVGAPKVGKSFLMAQLAYHVSMGLSLWGYEVRQGTVLYLALEDDHRRLQERLYRMFGVESTGNLFFAIGAKQLGGGLEEQLKGFVREHTDTRLIIIGLLLAGVMYNQEENPAYIGKPFQFGDYLIVVGIAVLLCPGLPDFLQGVDDNKPGVRVFPDKAL